MIILAEAVLQEPEQGLNRARVLAEDSPKRAAFQKILDKEPISFFLRIHEWFAAFLHTDAPLVLVTDWSDPCEVVGLELETECGIVRYPELCFLGFYTDWENLERSGVEEIFGHELSHLWLHWMGYDPGKSNSNRFHTCTAVTDPFLAFAEGFAEHLEIVSDERMGKEESGFFDQGYDLGAWLCTRDSALRKYAVKNNRFLYQTAMPDEDLKDYARFHGMHNTSALFLPQRLKNGSQAIASEGVIASFFYQMYRAKKCPADELYRRILMALKDTDLKEPTLFTDFVTTYLDRFPEERELVVEIFGKVTNFVTVSTEAAEVFGSFYLVGRQGNPDRLRAAYPEVKALKSKCTEGILRGELRLNEAVWPAIWITGDKEILPVPWEPERRGKLRFDINTATAVDYFSLDGLTMDQCEKIEAYRERIGGFRSEAQFREFLMTI